MTPEAHQQLNFLAGCPQYGNTTVDTKDCKEILLETGGTLIACGSLYNIIATPLGAGIYRLSLKPFGG